MFTSAAIPLALAASALANVFITNPVSTSSLPAGQSTTLTWQDNGESPSLSDFGKATFAIYVGNAIQQTPLQTIATSVDVSTVSALTFKPDATIGPNSNKYFIRVTSETMKNPTTPQYYQEAFSAMFSLTGMSGQFNASVQAQIDGESTAPIGGSTTSSPAGTASVSGSLSGLSTPAATATGSQTSVSGSATAATPSSTSKSTNGAGKPVIATGLVALVATLVGAALSGF